MCESSSCATWKTCQVHVANTLTSAFPVRQPSGHLWPPSTLIKTEGETSVFLITAHYRPISLINLSKFWAVERQWLIRRLILVISFECWPIWFLFHACLWGFFKCSYHYEECSSCWQFSAQILYHTVGICDAYIYSLTISVFMFLNVKKYVFHFLSFEIGCLIIWLEVFWFVFTICFYYNIKILPLCRVF